MNLIKFLIILAVAWGGNASMAAALSLDIQPTAKSEIIQFAAAHAAKPKVFTLDNPDRLVIDIPAQNGKPSAALPKEYKGNLITGIRIGINDKKTWRIVAETNGPVEVIFAGAKKGKIRIEIMTATGGKHKPVAEKKLPAEKPQPKKPLVVIDPGHGGDDPGTSGSNTWEKEVTLQYGLALRDALLNSGRYRVVMTREDDRFIILRERVNIARKAGAQLFISLHADSAPIEHARGLSVYTVSETASDKEAEALAARENKADVIAGMNLSDQSKDVAEILISLAQRDTKNKSATLAQTLVKSLNTQHVRLLENSHRFAGFAVLKAPDIPSVLVEIGFLSNPKDEQLINSPGYRDKLVQGLVKGVDAYFKAKNG